MKIFGRMVVAHLMEPGETEVNVGDRVRMMCGVHQVITGLPESAPDPWSVCTRCVNLAVALNNETCDQLDAAVAENRRLSTQLRTHLEDKFPGIPREGEAV